MNSTASHANKSPKIWTDVLRSQGVAVNAATIGRKLHETTNDLLVSFFFSFASHLMMKSKTLEPETKL
jgi:hypothetical protein